MRKRLWGCTAALAVLPFAGMVGMLIFKESGLMVGLIMAASMILQMPVILVCKKVVEPFICPDADLLSGMGVEYVPAAYEPGKFSMDSRISSAAIWLGMAAPLLGALAIRFPREVTVTVLNFYTYTAPSMDLLIPAFLLVFVGALALPFWFEVTRANAVFSEGSERKRYLLRGFADKLEEEDGSRSFLAVYRAAQAEI